jgi:hypothetical protein
VVLILVLPRLLKLRKEEGLPQAAAPGDSVR